MSSNSKVAKVVLWIFLAPLALCGVVAIVLFLVNIPDETLRSDVNVALTARHDAVPERDNLFFPLLAFNVRDSTDLAADGQRLYANYLAAFQKKTSAPLSLAHDPQFPRVGFVGDKSPLCSLKEKDDCIARVAGDPARVETLLADNELLLQRYRSLLAYQRFENRLHPTVDSPFIDWAPFSTAKRLYLTSMALDFSKGRTAEAVEQLRVDAAFTRRMLAEPESLVIDKMIMASSLRGDLLLANEMLSRGSLTQSEYTALGQIAAPLTLGERSLRGPFEREYEIAATVFEEVGDPGKRGITQHFFKLNATLNDTWVESQTNARVSEASCKDIRSIAAASAAPAPSLLAYIYNPIGRIMENISRPAASKYARRLCDLEALQQAVALRASSS